MARAKKAIIIVFVIAFIVFGYSQYASASQIEVVITQSNLIEENENESKYNVELKFQNPSFFSF